MIIQSRRNVLYLSQSNDHVLTLSGGGALSQIYMLKISVAHCWKYLPLDFGGWDS